MDKVKEIVQQLDDKKQKDKFVDTTDIIKCVEEFIKKKQLIMYGGFAVNILLSKRYKFYKDYTINDFDCFSANAKQDAKELAQELANKNFPYIKIRKALHENTYKVYVNFLQVIDLTNIPIEEFNGLKVVSQYEKLHSKLYRNYHDTFIIAPVCFLKASMHYELARPVRSYFRWEKIFYRLDILTQLYSFKKPKLVESNKKPNKTLKAVLKYVKQTKQPIIGHNAFKIYGLTNSYSTYLSFLSIEPEKTKETVLDIVGKDAVITKNQEYVMIQNDEVIIKIIKIEEDCFSYFQKGGYSVGSYDTTLYYMYKEYMQSIIIGQLEHASELYNYISLLEYNIKHNLTNDPLKRLKTECYGIYTSIKDILAKKWKKKQTLEYY